jgi:hypothetical protein
VTVPFVVGSYEKGLWRYDGASWTQVHAPTGSVFLEKLYQLYRLPNGHLIAAFQVNEGPEYLRYYRSADGGITWTTGTSGWTMDGGSDDGGGLPSGIGEDESITLMDPLILYVSADLGDTWTALYDPAIVQGFGAYHRFGGHWRGRGHDYWLDIETLFDQARPHLSRDGTEYVVVDEPGLIGDAWFVRGLYSADPVWVWSFQNCNPAPHLYRFDPGTTTFTELTSPVLGAGATSDTTEWMASILPMTESRLYCISAMQAGAGGFAFPYPRIFRSDDGGSTWATIRDGSVDGTFGTSFYPTQFLDQNDADPDEIVTVGSSSIWHSTDAGATWDEIVAPVASYADADSLRAVVIPARTFPGVARYDTDGTLIWFTATA